MSDGRVRMAGLADVAELARLHRAFVHEVANDAASASPVDSARVLSDAIGSNDWLGCAVVEGSHGLAACGVVYLDRRLGASGMFVQAHVGSMYTEPAERRKGHGRRVLRLLVEWACERGAVKAQLFASDLGRSLYESEGFYVGGPLWQRKLTQPGRG